MFFASLKSIMIVLIPRALLERTAWSNSQIFLLGLQILKITWFSGSLLLVVIYIRLQKEILFLRICHSGTRKPTSWWDLAKCYTTQNYQTLKCNHMHCPANIGTSVLVVLALKGTFPRMLNCHLNFVSIIFRNRGGLYVATTVGEEMLCSVSPPKNSCRRIGRQYRL